MKSQLIYGVALAAILFAAAGCTDALVSADEAAAKAAAEAAAGKRRAFPLHLSLHDPVGDPTGHGDVVQFDMYFDPATGAYEIRLKADEAAPFVGAFRVDINLWNEDRADNHLFRDILNEYDFKDPTQKLTLTGRSEHLVGWKAGERIWVHTQKARPDTVPGFRTYVRDAHHQQGDAHKSLLHDEDFIADEDDLVAPMVVRLNNTYDES